MADAPTEVVDTLIIACGNPMRGDDGVGPIVADQVEALLPEDLRARCQFTVTHQLLPELALALSQVERAVLIDARIPDDEPAGVVRVDPAVQEECSACDQPCSDTETGLTHHWTLPRLLMMADSLFGHVPEAYTVSVSADAFDDTDTLSPTIQAAIPKMREQVIKILNGGVLPEQLSGGS